MRTAATDALDLEAYDLAADHALNPIALPGAPSRLAWKVRGSTGHPTSAHIEAASSRKLLLDGRADTWLARTGSRDAWVDWPTASNLASRTVVWWRVQLEGDHGRRGPWSMPAVFEVALADASDWSARWITHPAWALTGRGKPAPAALPRLSRTFVLESTPVRARLYTSGLGVAETFVNGTRVGDAFLEPGYADYSKRIPVSAWDIAPLLRPGWNTIEAALGTGMSYVSRIKDRYSKLENEQIPPRYLAQLEIELSDGQKLLIATDSSWNATLGEDLLAHWYGGQDVVEEHGSALPVANVAVEVGRVIDFAPLWWKTTAPIRVVQRMHPTRIHRLTTGSRVYDFGTNIAGQIRAQFSHAVPGQRVRFWPGELLHADGKVDQTSTGHPIFDSFVPATPVARFAPTLTYHGFRYVEITDLTPTAPDPQLTAEVLRADLPRAGMTETSSSFLNTLHTIIDRAVQGNMYSVFTDCPHREKLGWIEELYLCFDLLARGYEVAAHLKQSLALIRDAQLDSGLIPSIVPEFINFAGDTWSGDDNAFRDDPNWGGAIVFLPWRLYTTYADRAVLADNWEAIIRYIDYLATREIDGLLDHGLGDWIAIDTSTPRGMVASFGYQRILATAAKIARELGHSVEAKAYEANAARVLEVFATTFGSDDGTQWGSGSQASYALALDLGAVPDASIPVARDALLAAIDDAGAQISVGENALPSLLRVLTLHGCDDIIDALVRQPDGPGYAHQITSGATALTESWQGPEGPSAQGSQNHFMLGMIDDWITGTVCGLRQAEGSIGWQRVVIAPTPLDNLDWAHTSYSSPAGEIDVRWDRRADEIVVTVALPPGVTADFWFAGEVLVLGPGIHAIERTVPLAPSPSTRLIEKSSF